MQEKIAHKSFENVITMFCEVRGGSRGEISPPKTYKYNIIHHDFTQIGKQHFAI